MLGLGWVRSWKIYFAPIVSTAADKLRASIFHCAMIMPLWFAQIGNEFKATASIYRVGCGISLKQNPTAVEEAVGQSTWISADLVSVRSPFSHWEKGRG
jgi:hypothetical protein